MKDHSLYVSSSLGLRSGNRVLDPNMIARSGSSAENCNSKMIERFDYQNTSGYFFVESNCPGYLVLNTRVMPGWKAKSRGQNLEIHVGNETMLAIPFQKGEHKIEVWRDDDRSFVFYVISLVIQLFSVLSVFIKI